MKGGGGGGGLEQKVSTFLKNVRLSLFRCQLSEILFKFQLWGEGDTLAPVGARNFFGTSDAIRCCQRASPVVNLWN